MRMWEELHRFTLKESPHFSALFYFIIIFFKLKINM